MSRAMTVAMEYALSAPVLRAALFCSMQFGDNTVNCWSGLGPMTWGGLTFQGIGSLGSISTISEDSTVEAKGIVIELSGIPIDLLAEVLWEVRVLGAVRVWFAAFDANGVLVPDPIAAYVGKMDQPTINDSGDTCSISITVENVLVDLNRACYRRYTNDDQQMDLAATLVRLGMPANTIDTGFRYIAGIQERVTFWGRNPSSVNNV